MPQLHLLILLTHTLFRRHECEHRGGDGQHSELSVARGASGGPRAGALPGRCVALRVRAAHAPPREAPPVPVERLPVRTVVSAADQPKRGLQAAAVQAGGAAAALLLGGQGR